MSGALDNFWAAPPVTRTLTAAVLLTSMAVYSGLLSFGRVYFTWSLLWKFPPEVWRIFTSFFVSGPGLSIIFDPYFIWQYGTALETESLRFANPGDFFIYIMFVGAVILVLASRVLNAYIYTSALITALAYTYGQENRGKRIKFIIIPMDVKWLPFAMCFLTFVMAGPQAAQIQFVGIPAAHLYDFLTRLWPMFGGGINIIKTPMFVSRWFGGGVRIQVKGPTTVFRPPPPTTSTWSTGWGTRGQGRRLGGD